MPNKETAKTKSAPKITKAQWIVLAVFTCVVAALTMLWLQPAAYTTLRTAGVSYKLSVARTPASRERGLGYRNSLPKNQGMLFVYGAADDYCFWMKGMRFPLDIIWTDKNHKVVHIEKSLQPSSYPQNFCPNTDAMYVIELNAGQAVHAKIAVGQTLRF